MASTTPPNHRISVSTAEVMGTVATFQIVYGGKYGKGVEASPSDDIPAGHSVAVDTTAANAAIAAFLVAMRADQAVFTTYEETSAIRRLARNELSINQAPPEVREVEQACRLARMATQGRFDAWWKGWFDPTGYVKGWSAARAFHQYLEPLLADSDAASPQIEAVGVNVGGDMQLATRPDSDWVWQVGIASPFDKDRMLARFAIKDGAVATSGPGERGEHIIDPKTGLPATTLTGAEIPTQLISTAAPTADLPESSSANRNMVASATVIADELAMADLWATTAVVAGFGDLDWIKTADTRSGMLVATDGRVRRWAGPVEIKA